MTERAYPLVNHILEAPSLRLFLFSLSLGSLAYFDLRLGGVMLDPNSVYPFLILLLIPASLFFKLGLGAINVVRRSCIATGVFVCVMNLVAILNNMEDVAHLRLSMRLIYSPLALGILLSFLISLLSRNEEEVYFLSPKEFISLSVISVLSISAAMWFQITQSDMRISAFFMPSAAFVVVLIMCIGLAHPSLSSLNIMSRFNKASLAVVLTFVISGVSIYTYIGSSDDIAEAGPLVAFSMLGMFYGSLIAVFTIPASGQVMQSQHDNMLFDWHLIEAYVFYALIIFPPLSFLELSQLVFEGT